MSEPRLSAADLRAAFAAAERWLVANRDGINAINVYPVPDGDTGTNMLLTLRAALRSVGDLPPTVGETAQRLARAALLGARGNSGVILSQMFRGFAEALEGEEDTSGPQLVHALAASADTAYAAVSQPVEGTMLTVLRDVATKARATLAAREGEEEMLRSLVDEAYASVERTPTLLARLRDAGVVDAGGAGIAVILEGVASYIHRFPLPETPRYAATERVATDAVEHEGHGYCTEFLLHAAPGATIDLSTLERALTEAGGDSLLVVGDARTAHVHVHLEDPGPALSIGARTGALDAVKVENMQAQHEAWMAGHGASGAGTAAGAPAAPAAPVGLVAIVPGEGLAAAFRDLGAGVVIVTGNGVKASAGEILEAARRAGSTHAIVLPNDRDVLMAAEAAAGESDGFLTVVATGSAVAGLAAAIYYRPEGDPTEIAAEMTAAMGDARCIEVTTAVRDATVDGVTVRQGQAIVLVDGRMHAAAESAEEALMAGLQETLADTSEIVTVYLGAGVTAEDGERVAGLIRETHPSVEVEVLEGGQPHYAYIASVE